MANGSACSCGFRRELHIAHTHAGVEDLCLLDGELFIDDRKVYPGDYQRAEVGSGNQHVWSQTGCTCVLLTSTKDILH